MVNYNLGKIYKIVCNTTGMIYIGSTCEPKLSRRLVGHRAKYKHFLNGGYHFVSSFEIIKNNNYEIILIENFTCANKDELHKQERFHIEANECVNKTIPSRTIVEYKEINKDKIKEQTKLYRDNHKEQTKINNKSYRERQKLKNI